MRTANEPSSATVPWLVGARQPRFSVKQLSPRLNAAPTPMAVRSALLRSSVTVTVAPGTGAPAALSTVPDMAAPVTAAACGGRLVESLGVLLPAWVEESTQPASRLRATTVAAVMRAGPATGPA